MASWTVGFPTAKSKSDGGFSVVLTLMNQAFVASSSGMTVLRRRYQYWQSKRPLRWLSDLPGKRPKATAPGPGRQKGCLNIRFGRIKNALPLSETRGPLLADNICDDNRNRNAGCDQTVGHMFRAGSVAERTAEMQGVRREP